MKNLRKWEGWERRNLGWGGGSCEKKMGFKRGRSRENTEYLRAFADSYIYKNPPNLNNRPLHTYFVRFVRIFFFLYLAESFFTMALLFFYDFFTRDGGKKKSFPAAFLITGRSNWITHLGAIFFYL